MITSLTAFTALYCFATLPTALLMHPVHETVCEIEWNDQTDRVEVALRLDALDEQWIANAIGAKVHESWQEAFLRSHLFFDPKPVKNDESKFASRPIEWIGRKVDGGHVWWFFEVVCRDGRPPTAVQTRLLFDRHHDYQHRLIVLGRTESESGKRPAILLTRQKPEASLELVD